MSFRAVELPCNEPAPVNIYLSQPMLRRAKVDECCFGRDDQYECHGGELEAGRGMPAADIGRSSYFDQ